MSGHEDAARVLDESTTFDTTQTKKPKTLQKQTKPTHKKKDLLSFATHNNAFNCINSTSEESWGD